MDNPSLGKEVILNKAIPWLVCFSAGLYFFYVIFQMSSFNTLSIELMRSFAINTTQLGNLSASYFYAAAIFLLPAGLLFDHFSTRKLLLITMCFCIISTIVIAVTQSFILAIICRAILGIGNTFAFLGCMRLVALWFPSSKMAFVMGLIVTLGMLGGVVAQTPLTLLLSIISWHSAILLSAAVGGLFLILIWLFVIDKYVVEYPSFSLKQSGKNLKKALSNSQNWFCGIYASLLNLTVLLLGALWGNLYLTQGRHLSLTKASVITSMIFIGLIIGAPIMGILSDWIKRRRSLMLWGAGLSLITILLIVYVHAWSWQMLVFWFFLLGFLSSAQVISYPVVIESNENNIASTAMSIVSIMINLAAAVSQLFFGWLLKWGGPEFAINTRGAFHPATSFKLALLLLPITFFISLVAAYKTRETYCKPNS